MNKEINGRENLLNVFHHKKPERLPRGYDTAFMMFPGDWSDTSEPGYDLWGVRWIPQPFTGQMVDEKTPPLISDITKWREQVKIPDPETAYDWEKIARERSAHWNKETQVGTLIMLEGHFERMHSLTGFEDALCYFYDEDAKDAVLDLFSEITKYKIKCLQIAKKYFNPDVIVYHDDWGTGRSMFFNPQIWHDFIKDEFKKIVDATHELGMLFELHSCGHIQEVIGDCVDIGINSIQTLQYPQNDIEYVKKNFGDRLVTRGGYDGLTILRKDVPDEKKRETILYSLSVLAPGGNHIPYFYAFGENPDHAIEVFNAVIDEYEKEHGPC